jgi:hypothetical protein
MTTKKTENELPGGVKVSDKEIADAKKDGALDYIKEGSGRAIAADTGTTGDPEATAEAESKRVDPAFNTTPVAPLLDLPADELAKRIGNDKVPNPIDLETAKALLALERNGKNRTNYVKMLCERIGVDSPYEVTHGGPPYTNDATNVSDL